MGKLITHNANALRFLMNEDLYDLGEIIVEQGTMNKEQGAPGMEVGGRRSEVGGQMSEGGDRKSGDGGVKADQVGEREQGTRNKEQGAPEQLGAEKRDFDYLGENNRYFLIIVDDPTHTALNAAHKDLLIKIMAAKKLELRDLAILNLARYPQANFAQLKNFFSCSKLVLFGIDPKRIGLPAIGANKVQKHSDVKVLPSFGLEEMRTNTDKKREFWNVMKDF